MSEEFRDLVAAYEKHFHLTRTEAIERAGGDDEQRILERPPSEMSWIDLHLLGQKNPELALARWSEQKIAALDNLRSGHRAAQAVESMNHNAWQRACFLALRHDLVEEWQPRNGIERQLLDTMAQAQASYLHWLRVLTDRSSLDCAMNERTQRENGKWMPPRLEDAEAMDQAAAMVDRFNRIFLRTLRALRDLRRFANTVIVQNGGQVNVAQQQQVNNG
jgi:hypothetical protein